ncbi:MAG: LysM peptidoglycan-binding domain-containing protein [Lachnospiraceae bacterium]|nr:LysM peptidoglycan-binding domain-containing protein [Lachnospiraceae bacterium]
MLYLVEHPDITLIYTVTYEGQEYTITIPAGKAIEDPNIPWYGPLWLLANYGGDNVPEIIAGSGKYTVVAGDTLSAIAEKFGTTVDYLAQKNGIKNPDYIIVGQVIVY